MASCLASSPAGELRYWPSIAHDGASIDENGILDGQEFDQLLNLAPFGYLLVTTTCNLVLLQLQHSGGRQVITYRIIKPPSGFFGGIGRKFASIVGFNNATDKENVCIRFLTLPGDFQSTIFLKLCFLKSFKAGQGPVLVKRSVLIKITFL